MSFPQTRRFWAQLGAADGGDPGDGPQDDATQPQRLFAKSEFFGRPLPSEAIAALVATFSEGRAAGQYRELDFMPWGGAYNRVPPEATAFVHRAELFQLKHAAVVDTPRCARRRKAPPPTSGSPAPGRPCTRGDPGACSKTSPTRTSTTGPARTSARTTGASCASRRALTRGTRSASARWRTTKNTRARPPAAGPYPTSAPPPMIVPVLARTLASAAVPWNRPASVPERPARGSPSTIVGHQGWARAAWSIVRHSRADRALARLSPEPSSAMPASGMHSGVRAAVVAANPPAIEPVPVAAWPTSLRRRSAIWLSLRPSMSRTRTPSGADTSDATTAPGTGSAA